MSEMRVIEPQDGWHPGDRAYCVRGSKLTTPTLETGRVYRVIEVIPVTNCVGDGIVLAGVKTPDATKGFWSSRFVKLSGKARALDQIARSTTPVWIDAYRANTALSERREKGDLS